MTDIIRLFNYVGSKSFWIKHLQKYKGLDFVELFAGSAILSINLAKTAVLNDYDSIVYRILKEFDQQIVPEIFTQEDYFRVRKNPDWYKYSACLTRMSFSNVFRYSKNGFNVPVRKTLSEIKIKSEYDKAVERWKELSPTVLNLSFDQISKKYILGENKIIISDPPYEESVASYCKSSFDYDLYWKIIKGITKKIDTKEIKALILFDYDFNITKQNIPIAATRSMCVNGKYKTNQEAIAIYEDGQWITKLGN